MRTLLCGILLAATAAFAAPANFSGKWVIQTAGGRGGGGRGGAVILAINQAGTVVTGAMTVRIDAGSGSPVDGEIHGGKVEGDVLTFYLWTGVDQLGKTTYKGTLSESGDEITFSVTGVRIPGGMSGPSRAGDPNVAQQMTAKRVK